MSIFMLLREFLEDIKTQKTRAFLTTIAISWGILAVTLLMAFGEGLSFRMQEGLLNAGDRIIRVYGGQTTKKWDGLPVGRRILLKEEDCKVIAQNIPQVAVAIPGLGRYFVTAVIARDYSLVLGVTVFFSALVIAANLVVDIVYAWLDPRTRDAA